MDIDFLILYSQKLQQNGLFESLFHDYTSSIDKRKATPRPGQSKTQEQLKKSIMNCFQPFSAFVKDRHKARTPDIFLEFGRDVLGDM